MVKDAFAQTRNDLIGEVESEIENLVSNRDIGFYYKDIETGAVYFHNKSKRYKSASTTKLPVVTCAYQMAADGRLNLDDMMTYTQKYYYAGSGIIRYQPEGSSYSIRQLVQYAVKHSDNIAYNMLRAKIGDKNLYDYIYSIKALFVNNFNSEEISVYLDALYTFAQENGELGEDFLSFFIDTEFEERIPAATPQLDVAHKVGMLPLEHIYHDAAIVYDKHPYILVIMTSGAQNNAAGFFVELAGLINKRHTLLYNDLEVEAGSLYVNGAPSEIRGAYISADTNELMIPSAKLLESLGIEYKWDGEIKSIIFEYSGDAVFIFTEQEKAYVGIESYPCLVVTKDDSAYVSASFFTDAFGIEITSNGR